MTGTGARAVALVAVLALGAVACGDSDGDGDEGAASGGQAGATEQVTLVLDWTPNTNHGGIYLAEAEGYYDDAGIDLEIVQPGETDPLQALGTGNADFAISVQESLIPARAAGVPAVSVAAIIEHNTSSLLALADSGITTPADLEGHRYGGFGGQLETALVEQLVECDGGDPGAVDFVEVGDTDYRVGLENGSFDFVWIFDGWDKLRLELEGVDVTTIPFIDHVDCIPDWYTPLIATSEDLIDGDPELVRSFLDATARGYQDAMEDPGAAADALLAAAPELDEALVRASADYLAGQYAGDAAAWGRQDADTWTRFAGFLVEAGLVEDGVDVEASYTNDFLPAA